MGQNCIVEVLFIVYYDWTLPNYLHFPYFIVIFSDINTLQNGDYYCTNCYHYNAPHLYNLLTVYQYGIVSRHMVPIYEIFTCMHIIYILIVAYIFITVFVICFCIIYKCFP